MWVELGDAVSISAVVASEDGGRVSALTRECV